MNRNNVTKSARARRIATIFALAGAVAGCAVVALTACSSSSPPPESETGDGTNDASSDGAAAHLDSSVAPGVDGNTSNVSDATSTNSVDGADARTVADTGAADAPYALVDVASLPDALGLDAYAPCDFLSCSPGCCESDGACVPGTAPTACGGSGNACVDCTVTSQTCNAGTSECQ